MQSAIRSSVPVRKQVHSNKSKVMLQEDDKKSQADRNCQISVMWPVKPEKKCGSPNQQCHMSTEDCTRTKPAMSTRCYKKHFNPKKRQKMQYKVKSNGPVNQEDAILNAPSEMLSPRSHQSTQKYKYREEKEI